MDSGRSPFRQYGSLVTVLLGVLVAGFVVIGLVGLSLRGVSHVGLDSRLESRNRTVQLRVSLAVSRAQAAALDVVADWEDLETHAPKLIAAVAGSMPPGTWDELALFNSVEGTYYVVSNGRLSMAAMPGGPKPGMGGSVSLLPGFGVFRPNLSADPALVVRLPVPVPDGSVDMLVLSVGPGLFAELWTAGTEIAGAPTLVDDRGRVIGGLWRRDGNVVLSELSRSRASADRSVGFAQPGARPAFAGKLTRFQARTDAPEITWKGRNARSVVPLAALNAFLVVEDRVVSPVWGHMRTAMITGAVGAVLAAAVLVLFIGFLRAAAAQTRSVADLSGQKNVLLSLLSHNLKNHFSAITSQAHSIQAEGGLLVSVDDAARVVSDCLYYLQLREGRFQAPPKEPVEIVDLVDFLVLRGERKASTYRQRIQVGVPSEPIVLSTSLNLSLEALERVLVTALSSSAEGAEIRVEGGSDGASPWVSIVYRGPGLSAEQRARMVAPFASVADESIHERALGDLGLYVARELLWNLDAELVVDEAADGRNRFLVHFPPL
jgi:signal transduction histidine kinase